MIWILRTAVHGSASRRSLRRASALAVAALVVFALTPSPARVAARVAAQSPNLLVNPDFEAKGPWPFQDGIRECQVPPGWFAFWRESPPDDLPLPSNCPRGADTGCYWARPEVRQVLAAEFPNRVHSGMRAVRLFTFGRMHDAGLYQVIEGIPVGARLQFTVWLQAWMCSSASACRGGAVSDAPARMHLQVGIDPSGGIDPWSPQVVWSPEGEAFDDWQQFRVEGVSETGLATVFVRSRAEWDWPRLNNDVYIDDASLMMLPEPTPVPVSNTLPGARYTLTPTPARLITHTVAAGETLGSIALNHGVSLEHIMHLNRLLPGQGLRPGQVLLIVGPEPATPTIEPVARHVSPTAALETGGDDAGQWQTWEWIGLAIVAALAVWVIVRRIWRANARRDG